MARPVIPIDEEHLKQVAERQWSTKEIAAFFGVDRATIQRRYAALIDEARAKGCAKLRDALWSKVAKGDTKVMLHMAKHHLLQQDKVKIESDTNLQVTNSSDEQLTKVFSEIETLLKDRK